MTPKETLLTEFNAIWEKSGWDWVKGPAGLVTQRAFLAGAKAGLLMGAKGSRDFLHPYSTGHFLCGECEKIKMYAEALRKLAEEVDG